MLYNRIKKIINRETFYYLIFGVLTTVINIASYELCRILKLDYKVSTVIAWLIAVGFAFITNKLFVFNSKSFKSGIFFKELFSFLLARILSGIADLLFMIFAVSYIQMNDSIAKIIANVFVMIVNYLLSKFFIFKTLGEEEDL